MLDYAKSNPLGDVVQVWGMSRWGSTVLSVPSLANQQVQCPPKGANEDLALFKVGFTPVSEDQHCHGLVSKTQAEQLCATAGATLCPDQATGKAQWSTEWTDARRSPKHAQQQARVGGRHGRDVALTRRPCSCGYDTYAIWSQADADAGQKYPRCCGQYQLPVACGAYAQKNIETCSAQKQADTCIWCARVS